MSEDITRREALKKGALLGGAALVWVRPSVQTYGMSATLAAQASGAAGCTPGFWKTNPGRWPNGIVPTDTVSPTMTWLGTIGPTTFEVALGFNGGPGLAGAERILFRAGAAAYLNAASLGGFLYSTGEVDSTVTTALASADRDTILAAAAKLDLENNAGCPLPADESPEEPEEEEVQTEQQSDQVFGTEEPAEEEEPAAEEEPEPNEGGNGKGKGKGGDDE